MNPVEWILIFYDIISSESYYFYNITFFLKLTLVLMMNLKQCGLMP